VAVAVRSVVCVCVCVSGGGGGGGGGGGSSHLGGRDDRRDRESPGWKGSAFLSIGRRKVKRISLSDSVRSLNSV
jgi:hypothetical protein